MEAGYVYVLINPSFPGMVKIGCTTRSTTERAAELSRVTGVPTPFIVAFEQAFDDCQSAEAYVHAVLSDKGHRTSANREFFSISATEAITAILATPGKIASSSPAAPGPEQGPADNPYWKSLFDEAEHHLYGLGGYLVDEKKAAELLGKSIAIGGLAAYPLLSAMYSSGQGVRKDPNHAIDLLKRGISAGNPFCAWKLGVTYVLSLQELEEELEARHRETEADKCFDRWIAETEALGAEWTSAPWFETSIPDSMTRDLFQMFEAGVMPDCLRPILRAFRDSVIGLLKRMQDYARRQSNYSLFDTWTNSLARFESAEL